jgi:hypothetical protein
VDTLLVAVGGGGDVITSTALKRQLRSPGLVIMTYSWDRLMVDPLPGPRSPGDFVGLRELAPFVHQVTAETTTRKPAGSSLPRLARELPARIILLDPTDGAEGMGEQIAATAEFVGAGRIIAVDVGGDALTDGTEPGLRSPLADQLALAACLRTSLPTTLLVVGAGLDGELTTETLAARFDAFDGTRLGSVTAEDVTIVDSVLRWHPTEASGLLAAAARGLRGRVEVRDAGDQVELTDETPVIHAVDVPTIAGALPARELVDTTSIEQAEKRLFEITGLSELRYEAEKAGRLATGDAHMPTAEDLRIVDRLAAEAAARGADHISMRRLAELLGSTSLDTFAALTRLLAHKRSDRYALGAYRVQALP